MRHSLTEIVKGNSAVFSHYRAGVMYYTINVNEECKYTFPVYLDDIADASLHKEEKAIMLMRYVRSAINDGTMLCE